MKGKKYNADKIKDLLDCDESEQTLAVCMIRQHLSLGETVELLDNIPSRVIVTYLPEMIVLAVYALPLYVSKGGVKSITFSKIREWAAKSPNVRPARSTFGVEMTKDALERYLAGFSTKDIYLQMLGHG